MVPMPAEAAGDADLARVITAWPTLPSHIKMAILTLLDAVKTFTAARIEASQLWQS
jgi:hypothetical protein